MTDTRDVEYSKLAEQVQEIEKVVNSAVPGEVGNLLKSFLANARSRMDEIRVEEHKVIEDKKERKVTETLYAVAHLVERENRLNAEEKQQYGEFLQKDYFTKADFGELEVFYGATWDKLSDEGKSQMSHRVWEGVRRNEFEYGELPEDLRRKEADYLYLQLTGEKEADPGLKEIPEPEKDEFRRAYEAGDRGKTEEMMSGKNFSEKISSQKSLSGTDNDLPKEIKPEGTFHDTVNRDLQKPTISEVIEGEMGAFNDGETSVNPTDIGKSATEIEMGRS